MKTILHISKYYDPDEGGIETVAKYLAEGLSDFNNIVICFSSNGHTTMDTVNGIHIYRVAAQFRISSQDICFGFHRILQTLFDQFKPSIVIVHCPNPFVYPITVKIAPKETKIVLLWHSDVLTKGILYKFIRPIETWALKRADLILATSPGYIHPTSPIYNYREKVKVLQNGLITSHFELRDDDATKIQEIKDKYHNKHLILFVGRHIPYKGINYLIDAEKYIKSDCCILIAGRGPETLHLKKLAKDSKRIFFLGKISTDELRCYYHAADIFGFASITKQEAFGVALAEAMYCGCIPVTFTIEGSGVNWVSQKGITGEEVALKDTKAYATAIDKILSNETLRDTYSIACQKRIKEMFTDKKAVSLADKILKNLI